jgi:hypothetical protein
MKSGEQIKLINALTHRVDEQQSLLSKLQSNLAMSPTSRAAVGTDGLVPLQLPVASGIGQSRLSRDSEMRLRTGGQTGHSSGTSSVVCFAFATRGKSKGCPTQRVSCRG